MADVAIQVENLGKKYRIGNHAPYARFTELMVGAAKAPFRLVKQKLQTARQKPATNGEHASQEREFWALKDVNFEIKQGEIVGVIGRNGAGKSTLLKLLSRITQPTTGRLRYRGRIGSLLEVGTGFHPELSGRDNIFLNGAILGMTRAEVRRKFDEIVAFAEVEKFLDTAVKHYSSGMYMRLAFAVAAHLEPEILLVDEVLAVGDAEFQKKCLGKMGQVAKGGRTVLFVSHNMAAVTNLCTQAIYLADGRVAGQGDVGQIAHLYQAANVKGDATGTNVTQFPGRIGDGRILFTSLKVVGESETNRVVAGGLITIQMTLYAHQPVMSSQTVISIGIDDLVGVRIATLLSRFSPDFNRMNQLFDGEFSLTCCVPSLGLAPGSYTLTTYVDVHGQLSDRCADTYRFVVHESNFFGTGMMPTSSQGLVLLAQSWNMK